MVQYLAPLGYSLATELLVLLIRDLMEFPQETQKKQNKAVPTEPPLGQAEECKPLGVTVEIVQEWAQRNKEISWE
jgi:hypothetical protein